MVITSDTYTFEFEPHQRFPFFTWARNYTILAQYWLVPGTDLHST